jgi:hypothetical protein
MFKQLKLVIGAALTATLVACGGGGDSGPAAPVVSQNTYALKTLLANATNDRRTLSWTLTGTLSGVAVTGSGNVSQGALNSVAFEGKSALAKTLTVTGTIAVNGTTIPLNSTSTSYLDSNYSPLGTLSDEYQVVVGTPSIPDSAKVGDTVTVYQANRYQNSNKTVLLGTEAVSFVLEADTSTTALLKIIAIEKDNSGKQTQSTAVTFRVGADNSISRLAETLVSSTDNISFVYK